MKVLMGFTMPAAVEWANNDFKDENWSRLQLSRVKTAYYTVPVYIEVQDQTNQGE